MTCHLTTYGDRRTSYSFLLYKGKLQSLYNNWTLFRENLDNPISPNLSLKSESDSSSSELNNNVQNTTSIKTDDNTFTRNDKKNAEVFWKYLENVFKAFPSEVTTGAENIIRDFLDMLFLTDSSHH